MKNITLARNFFYGSNSRNLKSTPTLPLCGNNSISFNSVEIFSKERKKVISKIVKIRDINKLPLAIKKGS